MLQKRLTTTILPEAAEISLNLVQLLGNASMILNVADALLYGLDIWLSRGDGEQQLEDFFGLLSSLGSIVLDKVDPIGNSNAVKYDHGVHSKALVESAKWFLNSIYDKIRGMVDAVCF